MAAPSLRLDIGFKLIKSNKGMSPISGDELHKTCLLYINAIYHFELSLCSCQLVCVLL
jgi:hypothetical protein